MTELIIIINIILLEVILSIDNASVLATMVKKLPKEQQQKALMYGIVGAYVFRGLCLVLAVYLLQFLWLKFLGGLYLIYLAYKYFKSKNEPEHEEPKSLTTTFWKTVVMIEIMDLAFSIDNIFAIVALTSNIYLIIAGVFIGILAIRYAATIFIKLLHKYPFLETSAYLVIMFLGIKLVASYLVTFTNSDFLIAIVNSHTSDMITSFITIFIFLFPIISNYVRQNFLNSKSQ